MPRRPDRREDHVQDDNEQFSKDRQNNAANDTRTHNITEQGRDGWRLASSSDSECTNESVQFIIRSFFSLYPKGVFRSVLNGKKVWVTPHRRVESTLGSQVVTPEIGALKVVFVFCLSMGTSRKF